MNNCHLFERLCQGLHPNAEIIVASKPFVPFDTLAGWNSDMRAMRMNISSASSNKYPGKSIIVSEATIKVQEAIDKNASLLLKEWKSNEEPVAIKSAMAGAESLMCGLESRLAEFRGSLKKVCNDRKITLDQGVDILARKAKQLFGPKLTSNVDTSNIVVIRSSRNTKNFMMITTLLAYAKLQRAWLLVGGLVMVIQLLSFMPRKLIVNLSIISSY